MPIFSNKDNLIQSFEYQSIRRRIANYFLPSELKQYRDAFKNASEHEESQKAYDFYHAYINMSPLRKFICSLGISRKQDPFYGLFATWLPLFKSEKVSQHLIKQLWDKAIQQNRWDRDAFKNIVQQVLTANPVDLTTLDTLLKLNNSENNHGEGHFSKMLVFIDRFKQKRLITSQNSTAYLKFITELFYNSDFINVHYLSNDPGYHSQKMWIEDREEALITAFKLVETWSQGWDKKNLAQFPIERYKKIFTAICLAPDTVATTEFFCNLCWQELPNKYSLEGVEPRGKKLSENEVEEILNYLTQLSPLFANPHRLKRKGMSYPSPINYQAIFNGASPELIKWKPKNQPPLESNILAKLFAPPVFIRSTNDRRVNPNAPGEDYRALVMLDDAGINIVDNLELCRTILKSESITKTTQFIIQLQQNNLLSVEAKTAICEARNPTSLLTALFFHLEQDKNNAKLICANFFINLLEKPLEQAPTEKRITKSNSMPNLNVSSLGLFKPESKPNSVSESPELSRAFENN